MSDLTKKPQPNYAPTYAAAMYPELAEIARSHGYALAVHGSLARDLDLIAIPWTEDAGEPQGIIDDILKKFAVNLIGEVGRKPHGRIAYTLCVGWGHCSIDLPWRVKMDNEIEPGFVPVILLVWGVMVASLCLVPDTPAWRCSVLLAFFVIYIASGLLYEKWTKRTR